ncbi:MAG TPA: 30S ribosomal protein S2 [Candidatus Deferrimicrobium sp.]|nr:30S ribosomal protein S2 [Candidatus Deferrimicrobium sp.]
MTEEVKEDDLLLPRDQYLAAGIHIGTQIKTKDMEEFIYRITRAGLYVIDIRKTDERMRIASKFISRFDPDRIVIVSARRYGHNPIQQFARLIGSHAIPGRFVPGTLTNPNARSFIECDLLVITDPRADKQALKEAKIAKIPVISFCDTDNNMGNIDLCVPANNRGRKALALLFWLLTRSALLDKGEIGKPEDFNIDMNSFQSRAAISYDIIGDQKKILEKIGTKEEGEAEEDLEEAPEELPEEELVEEPKEEVKRKKVKKVEELIKGPLPEKESDTKPETDIQENDKGSAE